MDGEGADAGFEADDEFADGGLLGWGDLAGMADEADGDGVGGVGETPAGGGFDGAVWGAVAVADDEVGGGSEGLAAPAGVEGVEGGGGAGVCDNSWDQTGHMADVWLCRRGWGVGEPREPLCVCQDIGM